MMGISLNRVQIIGTHNGNIVSQLLDKSHVHN